MLVLLATAFLALGLLNIDFSRNWWRGQRDRLIVGIPPLLVYCYVAMPPLVFPQAITLLLIPLIPNVLVTLAGTTRQMVLTRRIVSLRRTPVWPPALAIAAIAVYSGVLAV
jgi:hypothetical protein